MGLGDEAAPLDGRRLDPKSGIEIGSSQSGSTATSKIAGVDQDAC